MHLTIDECMHGIYGFGQSCLILLASCMKDITYDNYNTIGINETQA
jgi:hypothetical protein